MNQGEMESRLAREGDFDCFLLAGRYTLLDQQALPEFLPLCQERNISVIIGGPYNSGILASDLSESATFNYRPAPREVLEQARRCQEVCDRHGVPLKAAALQFVFGHPAVTLWNSTSSRIFHVHSKKSSETSQDVAIIGFGIRSLPIVTSPSPTELLMY